MSQSAFPLYADPEYAESLLEFLPAFGAEGIGVAQLLEFVGIGFQPGGVG